MKKKSIVLYNNGMGSLEQISKMLLEEMKKEIARNGYSDLTLNLEGAVYGIEEILKINNITEEQFPKTENKKGKSSVITPLYEHEEGVYQLRFKKGDFVIAAVTDSNITKGKKYEITSEEISSDIEIINDLGNKEKYSNEYFSMT